MTGERRLKELEQVRSALRALVTEIDYGLRPLPSAWRQVASQVPGSVGALFAGAAERFGGSRGVTAGEAWIDALHCLQGQGRLALSQPDVSILTDLGSVLGLSHRQDQLRHFLLADERLAGAISEARRQVESRGRLWRSLGLLSGILIAILMV